MQDIDCDIIRFAGLVGNDRHPIYSLAGKQELKCGHSLVNLVHLDDCARAIQLLLETPGGYRLYHLAAPIHPTREEYYRHAAENTRWNYRTLLVQLKIRSALSWRKKFAMN